MHVRLKAHAPRNEVLLLFFTISLTDHYSTDIVQCRNKFKSFASELSLDTLGWARSNHNFRYKLKNYLRVLLENIVMLK